MREKPITVLGNILPGKNVVAGGTSNDTNAQKWSLCRKGFFYEARYSPGQERSLPAGYTANDGWVEKSQEQEISCI